MTRVALSWIVLGICIAATLRTHSSNDVVEQHGWIGTVASITLSLITAVGTRGSLLLLHARAGRVAIDETATRYRLARVWLPSVVVTGVVCGAILTLMSYSGLQQGLASAAVVVAVLIATLFARTDVARRVAPRTTTALRLAVVDTAIPAALISAVIGMLVAWTRHASSTSVSPTNVAIHLAIATYVAGLLLGWGGALKTYSERTSGLVVTEATTTSTLSPVVVAVTLGTAILIAWPRLAPPLSFETFVVVKGIVSFVVGGVASALGALRGIERASTKL